AIANIVTDSGYRAQIAPTTSIARNAKSEADRAAASERAWRTRAMIGVVLWLPVELVHWSIYFTSETQHAHGIGWMTWVSLVASTLAMILVGGAFFNSS